LPVGSTDDTFLGTLADHSIGFCTHNPWNGHTFPDYLEDHRINPLFEFPCLHSINGGNDDWFYWHGLDHQDEAKIKKGGRVLIRLDSEPHVFFLNGFEQANGTEGQSIWLQVKLYDQVFITAVLEKTKNMLE
jgi:hypothetical protein